MRVTRTQLLAGAGLAAIVGIAAWLLLRRDATVADRTRDAKRALARVDRRSAHDALQARCRADGGSLALLPRACAALVDVDALEKDPQSAATRLHELSREPVTGDPERELLAELQVMRIELLVRAGHSRQAAREAQRWAEEVRSPSVGAVRLWVAAAEAQAAIGDEEAAAADAQRAEEWAARVR